MFKKVEKYPEMIVTLNRRGTRSGLIPNVTVTFPKKENFKRTVTLQSHSLWNNLPSQIRKSNKIATFKRRLNKYLTDTFCQDGFI